VLNRSKDADLDEEYLGTDVSIKFEDERRLVFSFPIEGDVDTSADEVISVLTDYVFDYNMGKKKNGARLVDFRIKLRDRLLRDAEPDLLQKIESLSNRIIIDMPYCDEVGIHQTDYYLDCDRIELMRIEDHPDTLIMITKENTSVDAFIQG